MLCSWRPRCSISRRARVPDRPPHLPPDVVELLSERLESIAQLEVLLLLQRTAPQAWDAQHLSEELRIEPAGAEDQLRTLVEQGLVVPLPGSALYRFEPQTNDLAKAVEALAACYADRRVSVVAQLYSKPTRRIHSFADAFVIRRDDGDR
jgi:hypothetical protein